MAAKKNILIVGANRGIGFNLVKAFLKESWDVTSTVRPQTLAALDRSVDDLYKTSARVLQLDYLDENTIEEAAAAWGDKPLHLLIKVAGLPPHPKPWNEQTADLLVERFRVMTVGPLLTINYFLPMLEKTAESKVVNLSSENFGKFMAYRVAKAALNQGMVTMAREWENEGRNVTMICVEPGFVATRLTKWTGDDDMYTCVAVMVKLFQGLTREDHGGFFKWDGTRFPF
ncbi:NAD(P)-binding protein [Podospora fimiseda]|uniref:NAD(P)-binding protein n=1 Tax=Podospora fimiseda TaxID=252190 RepID=A0AAN7BRX4_9PEZI|nr:NAD(P)-binding protein [Podospora fimiseda]